MDKGLNIEAYQGEVGVALALANTPDRAAKIIRHYRKLCQTSDKSCTWQAEQLAAQCQFSIDWQAVDTSLKWSSKPANHLLLRGEEHFPKLLDNTPDAPNLLFVKGNKGLLCKPQVAMVGSRKATHYGLANASDIATGLSKAGFIITSGLALGIDGRCHAASIAAGSKTIAVLGTGIERCYPAKHRDLMEQIIENGALLSEFPLKLSPRPYHFPRRNRIISGLSIAVVVVEASIRSGSLTTANHAARQGREVFAVPGSIRHPSASGCHQLIADGAQLVLSIDELSQALVEVCAVYFQQGARLLDPVKLRWPQLDFEFEQTVAVNDDEKKILTLMGGATNRI